MAGAWVVAMAPSPAATSILTMAPRRMSVLHSATRSGSSGRARFSRGPVDAELSKAPRALQQEDDSSYLWKLGIGSVGGAAAIKYGSALLPDITRPNIVQALLMVSLPVAAAVLIMLRASSPED